MPLFDFATNKNPVKKFLTLFIEKKYALKGTKWQE